MRTLRRLRFPAGRARARGAAVALLLTLAPGAPDLLAAAPAKPAASPATATAPAYELNDSHFHLTNYIQEGIDIHEFLKIMGGKVGRVALFGIPLQQTWSYGNTGDFAPTYYLQSDAPLYYYSFTDASIAMAYKSLSKPGQEPYQAEQLGALFKRHPGTAIVWAHIGLGRVVHPLKDQLWIIERALANPALAHVHFDISWDEVAKYLVASPEAIQASADL